MTTKLTSSLLLIALVLSTASVFPRNPLRPAPSALSTEDNPQLDYAQHDIGRLSLWVSNAGYFFGGEFPRGSYKGYLFEAGLWVGAVVDGDTLVSTSAGPTYGLEFNPAEAPNGAIIHRSTVDPSRPWFEGAVSHQDFIATFTDTCIACAGQYDHHIPLNIEVTRNSYSWAYDYAQDFVLFDYAVKNIGDQRLREIYLGIYVDGDVATNIPLSEEPHGRDDVVGFLEYFPATYLGGHCPPDSDLINIGWTGDNDGNRWRPQQYAKVLDVTGARVIRAPRDSLHISFNWWSSSYSNYWLDFGPQARTSYRPNEAGNYGTPRTDEAKYHYLRNGERDYDQIWQVTRPSWDPFFVQPPPEWRDSLLLGWIDSTETRGIDPQFLLSFGPFGLEPGQALPFTIAYVAGTHFQRDANTAKFLPYYPAVWYGKVRFDQLALNAMWAEWIYDNPGVDTDSDGYAGEFTLCNLGEDSVLLCDTIIDTSANPDTTYIRCYWAYDITDTIWRKGDGVPDFKGAYPPPNPSTYEFVNRFGDTLRGLRVFPEVGKIRVVWNGIMAENTPDPFSHKYDFEGYRLYLAHDSRPSSFSVIASYDRENFNRWEWSAEARRFILPGPPLSLEQLRCLYADTCGDTTWHPDQYPYDNPLVIPSGPKVDAKVFYFEPTGFNRSVFANDPINSNTPIRKVYPFAVPPPHVHPDSIAIYYPDRTDTTYFTNDGYLKYYEYEYTFDGILSTVPYYVNVTAFDHGYPELGLGGLEGDPAQFPKAVYALPSSEVIAEENLDVFVYPNPYRLDGDYRDRGFEARLRWHVPEDKTRLVHFANLPPKCTISIFSLDGDLIRQFVHDVDPLDYLANHETWNLINRNMQLVVSGLYYWTVEDDRGNTQIGKLVVIM